MKVSSVFQRWFPHPLVSVIVGLSWLMLNHSLEAGSMVMALILAVGIPRLVQPFIAHTPNIKWLPAIKLFS